MKNTISYILYSENRFWIHHDEVAAMNLMVVLVCAPFFVLYFTKDAISSGILTVVITAGYFGLTEPRSPRRLTRLKAGGRVCQADELLKNSEPLKCATNYCTCV